MSSFTNAPDRYFKTKDALTDVQSGQTMGSLIWGYMVFVKTVTSISTYFRMAVPMARLYNWSGHRQRKALSNVVNCNFSASFEGNMFSVESQIRDLLSTPGNPLSFPLLFKFLMLVLGLISQR